MIEIIGTEQDVQRERKWRSLPKNVRQIGENGEQRKIYIEDYVVTYLNKLARPEQVYARGAILFGNICDTEEGPAVFISGAVEAGNLELDMDETVFNELIWYELIKKGEQYFPGQEVAGWFLSRMGFSVEMNQKIVNTHLKNFPGNHKVLYMIDSLEKEDAMYLWENQQMKRQKGYYIYYEKNSAMQDYMLESENRIGKTSEEQAGKSELRRDRKIVNSYRRMSRYRKTNKKQDVRIRAIRAACGALILIMGIFIAGKLGNRFVNTGFEEYVIATFQTVKNVFIPSPGSEVGEEIQMGDQGEFSENPDVSETTNREEIKEQVQNQESAQESEASEEIFETAVYQKPMYYVVKKGDTLAAISRKMYSTDRYTSQIALANDLSNADEIYEGQKILIPSIE